jgi:hypothetical protein
MSSHHQQANGNIEEETRLQHKVDVIAGTKYEEKKRLLMQRPGTKE